MPQFNYNTQVNGQPNYQVGMGVDDSLMASNNAYQNMAGQGGGLMGINAQAPRARAQTQQVNRDQLMSEQMNDLTSGDSRYIQNARQNAREAAAARGMTNSSFAVGSAERAALDAAAPIAQFDASRYGNVADLNQQYQNQVNQLNANNQTQLRNTLLSGNLNNRNSMQQMTLGNQLGAIDDIRRQMFAIEDREDQQAYQGGQFNADLGLRYNQLGADNYWQGQQLGENRRQFDNDLGFRYAGLGEDSRQFDNRLGFDYAGLNEGRRQFDQNYGLERDRFAENQYQYDQNMGYNYYNTDAQTYANVAGPYFQSLGMVGGNPNLDAESIPNIMGNMRNYYNQGVPQGMLPPWMQNSQPPATTSPGAWNAASGLPPMGGVSP